MRRRWLWLLFAIIALDIVMIGWWRGRPGENRYDRAILWAARRYGVDPALVKAVIWRESRFNAAARGLAGEIGLMQIRALAAEEWAKSERILRFSHKQLLDPETNIRAGAWYLSKLLKRYLETDDPVPYALADYNAGRTQVLRWMQGPAKTNSAVFLSQLDFVGTRTYIKAISQHSAHYRQRWADKKTST